MSLAVAHYYYSTKHKKKPIRVEITVTGTDSEYIMDVHGRFTSQREASLVARDIICRYDEHAEEYGRITVEENPPVIETLD